MFWYGPFPGHSQHLSSGSLTLVGNSFGSRVLFGVVPGVSGVVVGGIIISSLTGTLVSPWSLLRKIFQLELKSAMVTFGMVQVYSEMSPFCNLTTNKL